MDRDNGHVKRHGHHTLFFQAQLRPTAGGAASGQAHSCGEEAKKAKKGKNGEATFGRRGWPSSERLVVSSVRVV